MNSPIQPAVGGAEDDLADRAATLFERAIMAGFTPAQAHSAALIAALISPDSSTRQSGGVDQAWGEIRAALIEECGHAATNGMRLPPALGRREGVLAVPVDYINAVIERFDTALGAAKKE